MKSGFSRKQGFSAVELIVTLLVVLVLFAIALPTYWDYRARARVMGAFATIIAGRAAYEEEALAGTPQTLEAVGLPASSHDCSTISVNPTAPAGMTTIAALRCEIRKPGRIGRGAALQFDRTDEGDYLCIALDFSAAKLAPRDCSVAGLADGPLRR